MRTLDQLKSPEKRPLIATVCGDGGVGKTSLAATFPKPVIIPTEDGTQSIEQRKDIAVFPVCKTVQDVFDSIGALLSEDHSFRTVVIDSITQLNVMAEAEVVAADPKAKSINQAAGGYGAGYAQVAETHRLIREACEELRNRKKINVVFIAHSETETVDPPDGDAYTRYTLRLHKKSVSHYTDNVDLVGYVKIKTYTMGDGDKKKATTDGSRIVTAYPVPSHVAKNRFGITQDIVFNLGENPFAEWVME
jgi:phage nucleotide-binding protein